MLSRMLSPNHNFCPEMNAQQTFFALRAGRSRTVKNAAPQARQASFISIIFTLLTVILLSLSLSTPLAAQTTWSVSGGALHSVAVEQDGSVWAWGGNVDGQLGDISAVDRSYPGRVRGGNSSFVEWAAAVSAGGSHNLILTFPTNGGSGLWTWGKGATGQLGSGYTTDADHVYVKWFYGEALFETGFIAASAGTNHSLSIGFSGAVLAAGLSSAAQPIGTGSTTNVLVPMYVRKADNSIFYAQKIAAGGTHSLALSGGIVLRGGRIRLGR